MSRAVFGFAAVLVLLALWSAPTVAASAGPDTTTPAPGGQEVPITVENTAAPVIIPDNPTHHLASTGSDIVTTLTVGFALIVSGILVMATTRRTGGAR